MKMANLIRISICCLVVLAMAASSENAPEKDDDDDDVFEVTEENIRRYFQMKRKQHLDAVKTLVSFQRYEQKYSMMKRIFEKIFEVMHHSRNETERYGYQIGQPLPLEKPETVRNVLQIIESCAFFANLVLKLPDISERLLSTEGSDGGESRQQSYRWCLEFAARSQLLDDVSLKMFHLAGQQLGVVARDPDFVNPYEKGRKEQETSGAAAAAAEKKKRPRKSIAKGPRMSKAEL